MQVMISAVEKDEPNEEPLELWGGAWNMVLFYLLGVQERPSGKVTFE